LTAETVVCVGAVVLRGDAALLVRQSPGHSLAGQWTVPWGRIEKGEPPHAAALREVEEEGGVRAAVYGLLGVQELPEPWLGWIALVYLCSHSSGEPAPRDRETDAADYYTLAELDALREPVEPWSNWLVRRVLERRFTVTAADASNPLGGQGSFL